MLPPQDLGNRLKRKVSKANKQFTMLAYPNRTHSINEGRNTTRHLYESLTRYLRNYTPP